MRGPGMPGPYRVAMGKWEMEVGRRGEGTPPYARIFKWGCRAASPLAAAKGLRLREGAREG